MTIDREEPSVTVVVCDGCGERKVVDLDLDSSVDDIAVLFDWIGWRRDKPEKQRFRNFMGRGDTIL